MPQQLGNPAKDSIYYGAFSPLADAVTIDEDFPEGLSKYIMVGGTGDTVFQNEAGALQFIKGATAGSILPIVAKQIVSGGTVRGTARTTTATNMGWLGGY